MSMPMHLQVVVVSSNSQIAGIAASILRGDNEPSIRPWISAAHVDVPSNKSSFYIASNERKFNIEAATSYYFIDVRRIDLWLALDAQAIEKVRTYIMHNGPPPSGFYRGVFPEPVVPCGFDIPSIPSTKERLDLWLSTLVNNLAPWKEKIWDAFRDSS
ncbi:MAG: hypothetical protein N2117_00695 [Anaerolineales bacterium]|nr:hypothetical protein [Anaerolineales bacterium]MDW8276517.1 hypothetical protein [Anaerolineales bacterium]